MALLFSRSISKAKYESMDFTSLPKGVSTATAAALLSMKPIMGHSESHDWKGKLASQGSS